MTIHDADKAEDATSASRREGREGDGHSTTPQVQTPDKPSQAEGDRETIDESIREKGEGDAQVAGAEESL